MIQTQRTLSFGAGNLDSMTTMYVTLRLHSDSLCQYGNVCRLLLCRVVILMTLISNAKESLHLLLCFYKLREVFFLKIVFSMCLLPVICKKYLILDEIMKYVTFTMMCYNHINHI